MDGWPPELTFLRDLEELMKCPICFDLMQAPVLLPACEHNYCSLCIRRYFSQREQCPTCGSPASSNQLRSNGVMEKTIQQFKKIRSPLRSLCVNKLQQTTTVLQCHTDSKTQTLLETRNAPPARKSTRLRGKEVNYSEDSPATTAITQSSKRPQSEPVSDSEDSDVQFLPEDENCSFRTSSKTLSSASQQQQQSVLSPSASLNPTGSLKPRNVQSKLFMMSDGAKISAKENAGAKRESVLKISSTAELSPRASSPLAVSQERHLKSAMAGNSSQTVLSPMTGNSSPTVLSPLGKSGNSVKLGSPTSEVEKVPCPVCGMPVVALFVNRHLDLCLGRQEKQSAPKEKRRPLPKLVYNLLSDKDLRKRLKELGLGAKGDRRVLIKRHHEFTLYHNADCDSIAPKDMNDLVKEFEEIGKTQMKLMSRSSTSSQSILRFAKDSKQEDIENAQKEYAAQHKDQFKSLIREARERMKAARKPPPPSTSIAPGPENSAQGSSQEQTEIVIHSDMTVFEEHLSRVGDEMVDSEVVSFSPLGTIFETEEELTCVLERDDSNVIDNETSCQSEVSELRTTLETIISKTRRSDEKSSDVLNDDEVLSENVCKETVNLSSQTKKTTSTTFSKEKVHNVDACKEAADLEEENDSDVFEYESKSQTVRIKSCDKGRGKRMLRPTQPGWRDAEWTDLTDFSQHSRGLKSRRPNSHPDMPSCRRKSRKKSAPADCHIASSSDGAHQLPAEVGPSRRISDQSESVAAPTREVFPEKSSSVCSAMSPSERAVAGSDCGKDSSRVGDAVEPSVERAANAEEKATNAASSDVDISMDSQAIIDPVWRTTTRRRSEDTEELIEQESRGAKKNSGKRKKCTKTLESDTQVKTPETDPEEMSDSKLKLERDRNSEENMTGTREVSDEADLGGSSKEGVKKIYDSASGSQAASDGCLKNSTEYFDLNLSDGEEEALTAVQETADTSRLQKDQLQDQQLQSKCEAESKNSSGTVDACHSGDGNTEDARETETEVHVPDVDQVAESSSTSQNIKFKSLLKKRRNNPRVKKSVRFAGLRARLSDIEEERSDPKTLKEGCKERGHVSSGFFIDTTATGEEAMFLADLRKTGHHDRSRQAEKMVAVQHEDTFSSETMEDDMSSEGSPEHEIDQSAAESSEPTNHHQDHFLLTDKSNEDHETYADLRTYDLGEEDRLQVKDETSPKKEASQRKKKKRKRSASPALS
ncbi:hypothetical protein ACOMHN_022285 [Nucella lapillus]